MAQYRKKPVVIEAVQWFQNGDVPQANTHPIDSDSEWVCKQCGQIASKHNNCPTLEGFHIVCPSDYIIKGVKGEYYPCKPDIFEMTYDKIDEREYTRNKQITMAQQTAVDWLVKEFNLDEHKATIEFAKAKEKDQIIFANYNGQGINKKLIEIDIHKLITIAEQYYKETYV